MRKTLYYLFFFFFSIIGCKKEETIYNVDAGEISYDKKSIDSIFRQVYSKSNDSLNREKLFEIANEYEKKKYYKESKETLKKVLSRSIKVNDTLHQAKVYWYLGDFYDNEQKLDTAFLYYSKAEHLYSISKRDSLNWAKMISYKAAILFDMGISTESEVESIKALKILNYLQNTRLSYETNLGMALNLKDLKQYDEALKYYNKIPDFLNKLENEGYDANKLKRSWLSYYNNLASFFNDKKQYAEGKLYAEKGLLSTEVSNYPKLHAMLLNNLAVSMIYSTNNTPIIDSLLNTSLSIRKDINHHRGIIGSKITIGEYLLMKNDTSNAIVNIKEAYNIALQTNTNYDILKCLKLLSSIDKENQNLYTQKYYKTRDSLHDIERATRNKFARIAYETQEVEVENTILIKRTIYYGATAIVFFLLATASFFVYRLKLRNKKLEFQKKEQANIQKIQELLFEQEITSENVRNEERDRIARDLHDSVVNRIFTTRLNLEKMLVEDDALKNKLMNELRKSEQQIREISYDIHHSLFNQKQSFSSVLENLVVSQKNDFQTAFKCSVDFQIDWNDFSIQQKTQLYLILQELLQNVNKHSHASDCFVFLIKEPEGIIMKVHDNGVGFNDKVKSNGLGLKSIQTRTKNINGSIEVKNFEKMTITIVKVPMKSV